MKHYTYTPQGVCSVKIDFDIEDGTIIMLNTKEAVMVI